MAKRKYDVSVTILTLVAALAPIFGAAGDKRAVVYASLCALIVATGYRIYKNGSIKLTKTALVLSGMALFFYVQLLWVSDKGAQVCFGSMFLSGALAALVIGDIKNSVREDSFKEGMLSVGYVASLIYSVCALLYQIFIESNFLLGGMNLGHGSSTATALIMLLGIVSALKLFEGREKTIVYYPSLAFMGIVMLLTGSFMGYLVFGVLLLYYTMELRHKRMEALGVLGLIAVLGVINIIYSVFALITGLVEPDGAFRGLVGIIGIGKGGYDASVSVLSGGYIKTPPVFIEFMETAGVFGLIFVGFLLYMGYTLLSHKRNVSTILAGCIMAGTIFTSGDALCYMILIISIIYASLEDAKEIKINKLWTAVCIVPFIFFSVLLFARVPQIIASDAADYGNYEKAADYYAFGAKCSLFDSKAWEKAYICATKAYENGSDTVTERNEYIKNALKFNKKNYLYRVYLADVYIASGNEAEAVNIWGGIIARYDREILYAPYARAICTMMEKGNVDLLTMESLYNTILEYANKATDSDVKFEVNNILTKSQEYYIEKREGTVEEYKEETEQIPQEDGTDFGEAPTDDITEEL